VYYTTNATKEHETPSVNRVFTPRKLYHQHHISSIRLTAHHRTRYFANRHHSRTNFANHSSHHSRPFFAKPPPLTVTNVLRHHSPLYHANCHHSPIYHANCHQSLHQPITNQPPHHLTTTFHKYCATIPLRSHHRISQTAISVQPAIH